VPLREINRIQILSIPLILSKNLSCQPCSVFRFYKNACFERVCYLAEIATVLAEKAKPLVFMILDYVYYVVLRTLNH